MSSGFCLRMAIAPISLSMISWYSSPVEYTPAYQPCRVVGYAPSQPTRSMVQVAFFPDGLLHSKSIPSLYSLASVLTHS